MGGVHTHILPFTELVCPLVCPCVYPLTFRAMLSTLRSRLTVWGGKKGKIKAAEGSHNKWTTFILEYPYLSALSIFVLFNLLTWDESQDIRRKDRSDRSIDCYRFPSRNLCQCLLLPLWSRLCTASKCIRCMAINSSRTYRPTNGGPAHLYTVLRTKSVPHEYFTILYMSNLVHPSVCASAQN